ncbi:HNH endonuclease signature motif containing protein [Saccharopolyspora tripterygii]
MPAPSQLQRFCGAECRRLVYAQRDQARYQQQREAELKARPCEWCNGPIVNVQKKSARFCCKTCRVAARYERRKDEHKAYRDKVRKRPEFREINRGYAYRRRAKQRGTQCEVITPDQVAARLSMFGGCWICGSTASEVEHVKPLAKGGPHILANLRPACGPCNRRKGARWNGLQAMMAWRERTARALTTCDTQ